MDMEIFKILSPSGREDNMRAYIKSRAEKLGCKTSCDVFGNLICGEGKVTIECGMDTVSIMKTAETDTGMIKIAVPVSSSVKALLGKKVEFLNGVKGVVRCQKSENIEDFDLSVDIGEADKESAAKAVPTGEFGTVICDAFENGKYIFGNGISSYIPILVMLSLMEKAKGKAAFVFTAGKKFAGRGIKSLLGNYETEEFISVNTTKEKDEVKCGGGAAVVIKEKSALPTVSLRKELISAAEGDVSLLSTDESLYLDLPQIFGKGAKSGGVCIAVRDKDNGYEAVSKADIESAAALILNYLKQVN